MTYEELTALQYGRSKSFADAQTEAMAAYCQAEHDLKQLQAENAKLREVLQDAYDDYCIMYTYVDDAYCFEDLHEDPLFGPTVRLLEEALGIEVDA